MNLVSQLLARLCNALGGATLVVMTTIVVVDVFMRTLLNQSLGFVEEITGYLVVGVTFFGVRSPSVKARCFASASVREFRRLARHWELSIWQ